MCGFNAWMVVGIVVTLLGTVWYGHERLAERSRKDKPPDEETPLQKDRPAKGWGAAFNTFMCV